MLTYNQNTTIYNKLIDFISSSYKHIKPKDKEDFVQYIKGYFNLLIHIDQHLYTPHNAHANEFDFFENLNSRKEEAESISSVTWPKASNYNKIVQDITPLISLQVFILMPK